MRELATKSNMKNWRRRITTTLLKTTIATRDSSSIARIWLTAILEIAATILEDLSLIKSISSNKCRKRMQGKLIIVISQKCRKLKAMEVLALELELELAQASAKYQELGEDLSSQCQKCSRPKNKMNNLS